MSTCSKCYKSLGLFGRKTIRGDDYCSSCAESVPSCDKCKYHYNSDIHPRFGCCAYFNQYLQDYDNVCEAYEKGRQIHPDVSV